MARATLGRLPEVILTIVIMVCILFMGTFAMNELAVRDDTGGRTSQAVLLDGTSVVSLGDTVGTNEQVSDSRGKALRLTGASDSYFQSQEQIEFATDETFTASVWASVNASASADTMAALSADGRLAIVYDGGAGQWTAWYYDRQNRESWQVNATATNSPGDLANVQVVRNSTHLTIYLNGTVDESINVTGENSVAAPTAGNWNGRIEEVRTWDTALNSSERNTVYSSPIDPVGTDRTMRIMFDQPDQSTQLLFYAPGGVSTSNASFESGLPGSLMDGADWYNDVMGTTDYRWHSVGPRLEPVAGGELAGAPVAYVDYDRSSRLNSLADDWNQAMGLAALLIIILPLGAILAYFYSMPGRR